MQTIKFHKFAILWLRSANPASDWKMATTATMKVVLKVARHMLVNFLTHLLTEKTKKTF